MQIYHVGLQWLSFKALFRIECELDKLFPHHELKSDVRLQKHAFLP